MQTAAIANKKYRYDVLIKANAGDADAVHIVQPCHISRELTDLLRDASPEAMDIIPRMEILLGGNHRVLLANLKSNVDSFQFKEAIEIFEQLSQEIGLENS